MSNYPKIGIRPTIDGRQGGVRESLEEKTMNLAKSVAKLISENLRNGDGSPVECVISDTAIGRVGERAPPVPRSSSARAWAPPSPLRRAGATAPRRWT